MIKKTLLSILAICAFAGYGVYEHLHGDQADVLTLAMADLATRTNNAISTEVSYDGSATTSETVTSSDWSLPTGSSQNNSDVNTQAAQQTSDQSNASQQESQQAALDAQAKLDAQAQHDAQSQLDAQKTADAKAAAQAQIEAQAQAQARIDAQRAADALASAKAKAAADAKAKADALAAQQGKFRNGSYTGTAVDVFYGLVQVKAIIQNGALADVTFLQYPNDRRSSLQRSQYAMPILTQEAIAAQSAQVDGISGVSDTSRGFVESLGSALSQAQS